MWLVTQSLVLMQYVGCYSIGFGPVSFVVIAEIFPLRVRGIANSIATLVNWTSNLVSA